MMRRRIIKIDTEKCNGCGLCAKACHEGAIAMIDGKAALMRDDYCDGLGDCLPACPTDVYKRQRIGNAKNRTYHKDDHSYQQRGKQLTIDKHGKHCVGVMQNQQR